MGFQLHLSVGPAGKVVIDAESIEDIVSYWQTLGGDGEWLTGQLNAVVKATEGGPAEATVLLGLGGTVVSREEHAPPTRPASGGTRSTRGKASGSAQTATAADQRDYSRDVPGTPDDDQANADDEWANEVPDDDNVVDPWDVPDKPTRPTPERHGSAPGGNRSKRDQGSGQKDNLGRIWTMNLPEAPDCHCGEPAGKVLGTSKKGSKYTVWKCAKDGPGGNYRDKCDFSEFPD